MFSFLIPYKPESNAKRTCVCVPVVLEREQVQQINTLYHLSPKSDNDVVNARFPEPRSVARLWLPRALAAHLDRRTKGKREALS